MPGAMPGGPPPGTPPQPPQGGPGGPLSALAGRGGGGPLLSMILAFLAGAGAGPMMQNLQKLMGQAGRGAKGGDQTRPHQGGVKVQGNAPPGQTAITPSAMQNIPPEQLQQILAVLAARQGGGPQV